MNTVIVLTVQRTECMLAHYILEFSWQKFKGEAGVSGWNLPP